tara:strand:+ start:3948 stop:4457 length:510 start_codon:yes stop_codon:yes gene_type:complete
MSYKHYVNVNEDNFIIKAFSEAFGQPTKSSICVNENGARQFHLVVQDDKGMYNKKYLNDEIVDYVPKILISEKRQKLIVEVKQEASSRILHLFPGWKQRNLDIEALLLSNKSVSTSLTVGETETIKLHLAMRDTIKLIRDKSNRIEVLINKTSALQLTNFNIKDESLWK